MFGRIKRDIQAVFERDPAARTVTEVLLCYSGLHAIWWHRVAYQLWQWGLPLTARFISQAARFFTGIEIHPAARIGEGLFIDHGMGVIIGETSELGRNVTLFQGVTLGGTGKERGKRHPTLGDNVMVGAGAKILGSFTVGDNAMIGANAVVLHPLPSNATAVGVPAEVVRLEGQRLDPLAHDQLPDPVHECMQTMCERLDALEARLKELA